LGQLPENRRLGTILNNDSNNILLASSGADIAAQEYRRAVDFLLDTCCGVLAQDVGMSDPVIYRSEVATTWDKYVGQIAKEIWDFEDVQSAAVKGLCDLGTDPLELTIEACRERGTVIVASFRMNSSDCYDRQMDVSDFGRAHRDIAWRPGGRMTLFDLTQPVVYDHYLAIFNEIARKYDVDGLELNFKRDHSRMIPDPHASHHILTRLVREVRHVLDEAAREKGRKRLLLGARVSFSMEGQPDPAILGPTYPTDLDCRDMGLDVPAWIAEGYVDYICPSYGWPPWPGLPETREFVDLAEGASVGVYPTMFPLPRWLDEGGPIEPDDTERMMRYRNEFCELALRLHADGADGISTFNWVPHHQPGVIKNPMRAAWGLGAKKIQMRVHQILGDPGALQRYLASDEPLPGEEEA